MIGWISLHRQVQSHWIWKDAEKFKWWVDILLTVNTSPAKINIGYEIFECQRGQSIMSIQNWASRWNVSKDTARNFLKLLEKDKMIVLENLQKTTRITVCKFDTYQSPLHDKQTTGKRKANDEQTRPHPNNKEDNNNNKNNDIKDTAVVSDKPLTLYQSIVDFWLKEFRHGFIFTAQNGREIKSIITKIKAVQKSQDKPSTDETVLVTFKAICENLPEWYKDKDLGVINSKFNELLIQIKNERNGKSTSNNRQQPAVSKFRPAS